MNLQPTLIGERVTLRPTVPEDWDGMYTAASDPLIWEVHPAPDRWKEPMFRTYFDEALASPGALTIRDRAANRIIGASRYYREDPAVDEVEIGWTFLAREYWGGSYNREVKRLMVNHALPQVGAVVFLVGQYNWRSQRAMEKIGGVRRPELRERAYGGVGVPQIVYEICSPLT